VLAFRPRRPGGPPRTAHVVQTQIMLSIVGSLVMLIVGASLARAFGIAGAASLVRLPRQGRRPEGRQRDAGLPRDRSGLGRGACS
jgi:hypothetical protein